MNTLYTTMQTHKQPRTRQCQHGADKQCTTKHLVTDCPTYYLDLQYCCAQFVQ
jgi:hypothetical protein